MVRYSHRVLLNVSLSQPRSSHISKVITKAFLYFHLSVRFHFVPKSLVVEADQKARSG